MAWFPIANVVPQYWKQAADGTNEYSGAVLKAYTVGTLTNIPFATDNTGGTTANSIALNANGNPEVSGNVVIPHMDQDYKLVLYPDQASADADSGATWTIDDLDLMGFDAGILNPEHATDSGTDAFVSATNTTVPDDGVVITRDFQSASTTTTPTLDGKTMTTRDGSALWAGAVSGPHELQYASGTDTYLVLNPNEMGVVDPEHATDSGTDAYVSATNTTPPADGVTITRDFQSANSTTTPTLDGKTITDDGGFALWAFALNHVRKLQYDLGSDEYRCLDPRPISDLATRSRVARDSSNRFKAADPSAAQDVATKGYTDAGDPTLDTVVDATNGGANDLTEIDFTAIKVGANRIELIFDDVSLTGTDNILVQLGDSGGFETSAYDSSSVDTNDSEVTSTSGFIIRGTGNTAILSGSLVLIRQTGNAWIAYGAHKNGFRVVISAGDKDLSAELDRVRVTATGTDTFDSGNINIMVE